jgi:hypothetical protein
MFPSTLCENVATFLENVGQLFFASSSDHGTTTTMGGGAAEEAHGRR